LPRRGSRTQAGVSMPGTSNEKGQDNSPERVEDWSHQLTLLPHWQQTTDNWQLFVSPRLLVISFDHSVRNGDFLRTMTFEQTVRIAEGYSELGMLDDALVQLDQLDAEHQDRLEILRMRVDILLRKQDWKDALQLSLRLCIMNPDQPYGYVHAAFCLHELGQTSEAKQTLLDGPAALLDEPVYYYNLACYDTVLGNLEQAKVYLRASFSLDKSFRELAKNDPDLKQIRDAL
jgi:predicted Zn-dependent protease